MTVIDATVAFKALIATEGTEKARDVLKAAERLIAPELLIAEICNALATLERANKVSCAEASALIRRLPGIFDVIYPIASFATRAFEIASDLRHPAYDCFYLALAELEQDQLVTADKRLLSHLAGTRYELLARPL